MTATVTRLAERIRSLTPDRQIDAIARDVDGLDVLARQNAEAQRATGDAVEAIGESLVRGLAVQREHGERLERIEAGLLEALEGLARIERRLDGREASDVDLLARVEREQAARETEDARILALVQRGIAPAVADAKQSAAEQGASTRKAIAGATGGLTAVYTVVQILRETGVLP